MRNRPAATAPVQSPSNDTYTAAAFPPCTCDRKPSLPAPAWLPASPPAPLAEQLSSLACTAPPVRRSFRPSHCHGLAHRRLVPFCLPSVPPLRSRLRMLCQLARAAASVNFLCTLRAEPKISAPLTYLQLNAQILHRFSKAASGPPSHLGLSPRCRGRLVVRWLLSRVRTGPSAARCRNAHRLIPCIGLPCARRSVPG